MISETYKKRLSELAGIQKLKEIIFLVGLPGSGKSTFVKKLQNKNLNQDYVIVSFDSTMEKIGAEKGLNYNDSYEQLDFNTVIFPSYLKKLEKSLKKGKNIIVDNTNIKKSDRKSILKIVPNDYEKIAIVFNIPSEELKKRLNKRAEKTGKYIPDEVIEKMKKAYTPPSKSEGFDKIINF